MATESFELSRILPAAPEAIYDAWLDAEGHSKMTGAPAQVEPGVGGKFSAAGGYIQGQTLELEPNHRILQAWRSSEFPAEASNSLVEVLLEPVKGGTQVTLRHLDVPEGQGERYRKGWEDFYFAPMERYFASAADTEEKPKARRARPAKQPSAKAAQAPAPAEVSMDVEEEAPETAAPARKAARKRAAAGGKRKAARKAVAKRAAKQAGARKAAPRRSTPKRAAARKAAPKRPAPKKTAARKATPKRPAPKKAAARSKAAPRKPARSRR